MARVVSIHEYQLKPDADRIAFERAFRNAEERGLFGLPDLIEHHFLKRLKAAQQAGYSAIWIYESRGPMGNALGSFRMSGSASPISGKVEDLVERNPCAVFNPASPQDSFYKLRRTLSRRSSSPGL